MQHLSVRRLAALIVMTACTSDEPSGPSVPEPVSSLSSGASGRIEISAAKSCEPPTTPLAITTTSLPNGNVGTFYVNFISAIGGSGPLTFRLIDGKLPAGLKMASFGVQSASITGTPKQAETAIFTVELSDGCRNTASATLTLTIDPPRPLVITNGSPTLAPGTVGEAYAANLFADGGVQPFQWAIVAGQLPPGLSLKGNTISGTPTTVGSFTFTAQVTDDEGSTASQEFTIVVS